MEVTPELAKAALRAVSGTDMDIGVHLALGASLRREEVLALRVGEVDLNHGVARISRVLVAFRRPAPGMKAEPVFGPPKTASGAREVELPAFVVQRLRTHLRDQAKRRLVFGDQWRGATGREDDLIVEMGDGSPWRPDSYSRKWAAIAKKIEELHGLTFHGHRRGFGTLLLVGHVDAKVVSELMGHSSTAVTQAIYQTVIPRLRREAGAALDTLIG